MRRALMIGVCVMASGCDDPDRVTRESADEVAETVEAKAEVVLEMVEAKSAEAEAPNETVAEEAEPVATVKEVVVQQPGPKAQAKVEKPATRNKKVITTLQTRYGRLQICAGNLFVVADPDGDILASDLTEAQLREQFPGFYGAYRKGVVGQRAIDASLTTPVR